MRKIYLNHNLWFGHKLGREIQGMNLWMRFCRNMPLDHFSGNFVRLYY